MNDLAPAIVIDNGSSICKAGISGDETARFVLDSTVRYPGQPDDAICRPITRGVVTDWAAMEAIWQAVLSAPQLDGALPSAGHPVLITEPPLNPRSNREMLAQHLFETFNAPSLHIAIPAVLAMYASGRATGTVLDSGDGVTHVVPVYEGYSIGKALQRANVGGGEITEYLTRVLACDSSTAKRVKEEACFVASSYEEEKRKTEQGLLEAKLFVLPDGKALTIDDQRFQATEGLFGPAIFGLEADGLQDVVFNCITSCDIDLRRLLYNNVILSGGNTMFSGIADRMRTELLRLTPSGIAVQVVAPSERNFSAWVGGSILSSLSTFQKCLISQEEYNETGPLVVHTKDPFSGYA